MSKRTFSILLLVSIAFNIAVISTVGVKAFRFHRMERSAHTSFKKIKETCPNIHRRYKMTIRVLTEKNRDTRIVFIKELIKENPNYNYLELVSDSLKVYNSSITKNIHEEMIEIRKSITVEEARDLFSFHLKGLKKDEQRRKHRPTRDDNMRRPPR